MPGWLARLIAIVWRRRREIVDAGQVVAEVVEKIVTDAEPPQPLPYSAVEHNRAQERSAIDASKRANAERAAAPKPIDREAITPPHGRPIPPLPPSKRTPDR